MDNVTSRTLVLTFGLENGKELSLTINKPKEDLTGEAVAEVMNQMIAAEAFGSESLAQTVVGAKYVVRQETELELE